ncbi:MAG TPA: hypothetical protein VMB73_19975 [Acetobacteraceae bacterium]|nr:hypothetical protein [Acetobacteraceae bacterium]
MTGSHGHELDGLIKWCARDDWRAHVDDVVDEHFGPAMDAFDLTFEELGDAIGNYSQQILWGCAFEDFLTRRFGPDAQNPADLYVKSRGWRESTRTRTYIAGLRKAAMSLYEVSDVVPGESFRARDLIRGGEPVLVTEHTATRQLQPWDRLAMRLVLLGSKNVMSGGMLTFTLDASRHLFAKVRERYPKLVKTNRHGAESPAVLDGWAGTDADLQHIAPLFSEAWSFDVLPRVLGSGMLTWVNSDGDELEFHSLTFPLKPRALPDEIARRLGTLESLRRESPTVWNWIGPDSPAPKKPGDSEGRIWKTLTDDGFAVFGTVALKGRSLSLEVNSAARAERGSAMLATALADLAGAPLTKIETMEQVRSAPRQNRKKPAPDIPLEVKTGVIHDMLDRHYREALDKPLEMLGNISPRAAARTAAGRRNVAAWLKYIENNSRKTKAPHDPLATYDFSWLWRELKIEQLRQ